jgi:hypothetical protein
MATYVNDLRLKEITTGDESGTWGTSTNTNLELIAEAFSYGTEVITTNADTHTTTIADGATDPGRALYLKYTGTLDSACTITIGPNTVSKVWIVENGTSGSQDIILSQGSGANITIPAGDTKVVYSDGAGAGAAFFDAFASLSVVDLKVQDDLTVTGDIDVDGTTNLDVVDIDGAVDMASTLGVTGVATLASLVATTADINGGTVDGTVIGGTTAAAISGTTGQFGTSLNVDGTATINSFLQTNSADYQHKFFLANGTTGVGYIYSTGSTFQLDTQAAQPMDLLVNGTSRLNLGTTGSATFTPAAGGHAVFNEGSVDADFRVESNGNANMLFVDGGNDAVGIGTNVAGNSTLEVRSTGVDGTFANAIGFQYSGNSNEANTISTSVSSTGGGSGFKFNCSDGGGSSGKTSVLKITRADMVVNDDSTDYDFRVESDADTHALFVEGSSSNVLMGTSTSNGANAEGFNFYNAGSGDSRLYIGHADGTLNGTQYVNFLYNTSIIGSISQNGVSQVLYNVSSDYRLKENIADADDAGSKIDAIQVRKFDWKVDGSHQDYGMVAQELQTVAPEAVSTPENPDEMMGVDYSKLVPMMLKEIQTLRLRITALENA